MKISHVLATIVPYQNNNDYHHSSRLKYFGALLIPTLTFWLSPIQAQLLSCESDYVSAKRQTVEVRPNGVDDTGSIQCALNSAVAYGYPTVLLTAGDFYISSIVIQRLNAKFVGTGIEDTVLTVMDASIDCDGMNAGGMTSAAMKFSKGEPRIRNMTIIAGQACVTDVNLQAVIHFTGLPNDGIDCSSDVIYGLADRLVVENPDSATISAVRVSPEGGCKDNVGGTFKLNRSQISGFSAAVVTAMRASSQVDINFNQFTHNRADIVIPNANQSTTITRNNFSGVATSEGDYMGVQVLTNDVDAPDQNRVVIHKNTFDVEALGSNSGAAIVFSQTAKIVSLSTIASENTFSLEGSAAYGIISGGVSGSIVNGNRFAGTADTGIFANPADSPASSDWAILANTGFKSLASQGPDIILGPDLSNSIVGAEQTDKVQDLGEGNSVLPIEVDAALEERVAALEAMVAALSAQLDTHTGDTSAHHARYADAEAVAAVGPHFSGNHSDLTNVTAGQHHADVLTGVSRGTDPNTGKDTLTFSNMNVQIVSGSGSTDASTTGMGNLIIGYNELRGSGDDRSGSHMLVIGQSNNYTASSYGGMVVGLHNETSNQHASISGGSYNKASGSSSSVSGGYANTANGHRSSVSGGILNIASSESTSVSGGHTNTASDWFASVSGGQDNTASERYASVSGGESNTASGYWSSVSGGRNGIASDLYSSVSGGHTNTASGQYSSVSGGRNSIASGQYSSVSGGYANTASSESTSVSGGYTNIASGWYASVSGGQDNTANGLRSSVSGGYLNKASGPRASVSGGSNNTASGDWSSVSGGRNSIASSLYSSVSGGHTNTASGFYSSVSGGYTNIAIGWSSSVSGGQNKTAATNSCWTAGGFVDC